MCLAVGRDKVAKSIGKGISRRALLALRNSFFLYFGIALRDGDIFVGDCLYSFNLYILSGRVEEDGD